MAFRFVVAFLFLGAFALVVRRPARLSGTQRGLAALLGVAFFGVVALFTVAINLAKLGNTVFLLYAGSIVTSLLVGTLVFRERLRKQKLLAIALALLGLSMYSSALLTLSLGVVAAVMSGVLDGVANGLRKTLGGVDRTSILFHQYAAGSACALLVLAAAPQDAIRTLSFWPIAAGVLFAALLIGLGNLLLYGFQHFDVNVGTVILATELFFASALGWIFLGEVPAPHEVLGGSVIFLASILSAVDVAALVKRPANSR